MASRVELPKEIVKPALEQRAASLKRSQKAASNKLIADAYEKELEAVTLAINTITEIK